MIGTELRGPAREATGKDPFLSPTQSTRSIVMDSPYDYDPFWRKCIELEGRAGLPHLLARHRLSRLAEQLCLQSSRRFRRTAPNSSAAR